MRSWYGNSIISDYYVILSQGMICVKIIAFDRFKDSGIQGVQASPSVTPGKQGLSDPPQNRRIKMIKQFPNEEKYVLTFQIRETGLNCRKIL